VVIIYVIAYERNYNFTIFGRKQRTKFLIYIYIYVYIYIYIYIFLQINRFLLLSLKFIQYMLPFGNKQSNCISQRKKRKD